VKFIPLSIVQVILFEFFLLISRTLMPQASEEIFLLFSTLNDLMMDDQIGFTFGRPI
jgi:hypothetical protein